MSIAESESYSINNRYVKDSGKVFLTGVQAIARLPIQQLRADRNQELKTASLLAGYPGSPLAGLNFEIDNAAKLAPDLPIIHRPVLNEEHGATAIMGSQLAAEQPDFYFDGVVGFWYGKAPGLDRAGDALRHAVFAGTSRYGGAVAVVGDDPAAKSSTLPSSSDATLVDLHMPILYPGDVKEIMTLGMHAIALSRITGAWTALKVVDAVADGSGTIDLASTVIEPIIPDLLIDGVKYQHRPDAKLLPPNNLAIEKDLRVVRSELVRRYTVANNLNPTIVDPPDAWIGLIASGFTYHELRHALYAIGLRTLNDIEKAGIRLLHLQLPIPFDPDNIRNFARGLEEIMVIEEKNPTAEWLVKDALYGNVNQPRVLGKSYPDGSPLMPSHGILDANAMVHGIFDRLSLRIADRLVAPRPQSNQRELIPLSATRSPYFCSGCPHNSSTKVPEDSLIGAGIGCHTMVLLMDEDQVGNIAGVTAMGNEGMQWVGMEPFVERKHFIQNIGDGTYFHSGQLAVASAISANSNITFKLLFNGTIAMTGGQDPKGGLSVDEICRIMVAQGVKEIIITTEDVRKYRRLKLPKSIRVWDRARVVEAQEVLAGVDGVTVLIHDQACAAQLRRMRKRNIEVKPDFRVLINHRICEACGDCGEVSNCLSVQNQETILGPKAHIDQDSCNFDASCVKGDCPSFMTVEIDPEMLSKALSQEAEGIELPEPEVKVSTDKLDLRIAGIGGTGVVTAAQILATAAMLDGYEVRGLDQTGLSQKAGPVVSDLRLTRDIPRPSNLLMDQSADVIIGFDLLVAASDRALDVAMSGKTILIASETETPTGEMVGNPLRTLPTADTLLKRLSKCIKEESSYLVDAGARCKDLLGSVTSSNIFLLGVAVQYGALPVSPQSFEQAIKLNNVNIEGNLDAFHWGRAWVFDSDYVERVIKNQRCGMDSQPQLHLNDDAISRIHSLELSNEDVHLISFLANDVLEFQNNCTVQEFISLLEKVNRSSIRLTSNDDRQSLITAVARNAHKLIAYKDEYEVARLFLSAEIEDQINNLPQSRGAKRATWYLHPPFLRAMGLKKKLKIPYRIAAPAMKLLRKGKHLRGTKLDPFGYAKLRKIERQIRDRYIKAVAISMQSLSDDNYSKVYSLAVLPNEVRGFEDIKLKKAEEFLIKLTGMEKELSDSCRPAPLRQV
tara:strand:- start:936 stop:4475 length:3540 start_codon:yes stop_codon:yes gene_type:complete